MEDKDYLFFDVRNNERFLMQEKSQNCQIKPCFDLEKEDGKIIYGRELSYLGRGGNATVWKYEQDGIKYAVKIFFEIGLSYSLRKEVYQKMKNLSLNNTLKALETLNVIHYDESALRRRYYAYIMEYLEEKKNYSIVDMPTSMLLENTSFLELDAKMLAQSSIVMRDVKMENTVFNKANSMFYISDIDMFELGQMSVPNKELVTRNYIELQYVFYDFLAQYSSKYYHGIYNDLFGRVFFRDIPNKSITEKLESLFASYDTPKQFFKDNKSHYDKR